MITSVTVAAPRRNAGAFAACSADAATSAGVFWAIVIARAPFSMLFRWWRGDGHSFVIIRQIKGAHRRTGVAVGGDAVERDLVDLVVALANPQYRLHVCRRGRRVAGDGGQQGAADGAGDLPAID